jgi:hypothetical protein
VATSALTPSPSLREPGVIAPCMGRCHVVHVERIERGRDGQ